MLSLESKQDVLPNPRMHRKGHYRRHSLHSLQSLNTNEEPILKQHQTVTNINRTHRRHERVSSLDGVGISTDRLGTASRASEKIIPSSIPFASSKYLFPIGRDSPPNDGYFSATTEEKLEDAYADFWKPTVSLSLSSKSMHDKTVSTQVASKLKEQFPLSMASVYVTIDDNMLDRNTLIQQLTELGASIHQRPQFNKDDLTTHMVLPKNSCFNSVLDTISSESTIKFVSPEWIAACYSTKKWVNESAFRINFKSLEPKNRMTAANLNSRGSQVFRMKTESHPFVLDVDIPSHNMSKANSKGIEYNFNPSFAENTRLLKEKSKLNGNTTSLSIPPAEKRPNVREGVLRVQETSTWNVDSPFSATKLSNLSPQQRKELESAKKKYLAYEPIVGSPLKQRIPFFDL
ncbi:BRCT domain-containing protein [Schizosaccharomyces octosporus yFS286]|uniref:BRCT domain-containing protein n=1 Tax=Schizosaccharomyces octosporus (strain yFS286) TaxID=483514 RepID=S9R716_SCHOY|nr:BRCT domain-containing protein [Schizosaccharomyces octosporus yFS286]EPX74040.1 BRCT domain-containing protein [Schizosaccharomyces octosporus yFS286]